MGPSQIRGGASDTVSFLTKSCEPDKPAPPKLVSRNKTSLNLRWNAPNVNGKSILQYILESDEGRIPPQQVCMDVFKNDYIGMNLVTRVHFQVFRVLDPIFGYTLIIGPLIHFEISLNFSLSLSLNFRFLAPGPKCTSHSGRYSLEEPKISI